MSSSRPLSVAQPGASGRRIAEAVTSSLVAEGATSTAAVPVLRALAEATELLGEVPRCRIEPFTPGRRSSATPVSWRRSRRCRSSPAFRRPTPSAKRKRLLQKDLRRPHFRVA